MYQIGDDNDGGTFYYEDDKFEPIDPEEDEHDDVMASDPSVIEVPITKKYGIVCYFRKQDEKTSEHVWNVFAEWRSGSNLIHSEFYFTRHKKTLSVDSAHPVFMQKGGAKYANKERWEGLYVNLFFCLIYMYRVIWVHKAQYRHVYNFCKFRLGQAFDSKGIYFFDLRQCCTGYQNKWVCSRLMTAALIDAGILPPEINPMSTTPGSLRKNLDIIKQSGNYVIEKYDIEKPF